MLENLKGHLDEIDAQIEAVKAVDDEAEIKAKVAAYEETVRADYSKAKAVKIDKLNGIKLGIQYVIDAEAQKQAELKATEEERRAEDEEATETVTATSTDAVVTAVNEEA